MNGELSQDQIETLNAYGPYTMAVWSAGQIKVGNEEGLKGRSAFFLERIRESILAKFTMEEIKTLSILDIGCNDGWVLHQLSDLPFARMVGIEPREKNIAKGRKVREILNLPNKVEYKVGDIESLGEETFDIVICAGVLYHVESIPGALRKIRSICKKMLFIETRCLSSNHATKKLKYEIEMRDVVYKYEKPVCGLMAQKFETSYNDGSAKEFSIVHIPTVESLTMNLTILGFEDINIIVKPESYRALVWQNKRPLNGVCLTAYLNPDKKKSVSQESAWLNEYEKGHENTIFKEEFIRPLYDYYCQKKFDTGLITGSLGAFIYLSSPDWLSAHVGSMLPLWHKDKYELEIIKNFRYSPVDKISLEYGKLLFRQNKDQQAIAVLKSVTTRLNADWRAVYRSFKVLSEIYKKLGFKKEAEHYRQLYFNCNSKAAQE